MVVTIGKDRLYVECKRIKSLKKLASRMKEASNQINARIGANRKNKYGLIALDVTDVLLPEGAVTATSDVRLYDLEIQKAITGKSFNRTSKRRVGYSVMPPRRYAPPIYPTEMEAGGY